MLLHGNTSLRHRSDSAAVSFYWCSAVAKIWFRLTGAASGKGVIWLNSTHQDNSYTLFNLHLLAPSHNMFTLFARTASLHRNAHMHDANIDWTTRTHPTSSLTPPKRCSKSRPCGAWLSSATAAHDTNRKHVRSHDTNRKHGDRDDRQ